MATLTVSRSASRDPPSPSPSDEDWDRSFLTPPPSLPSTPRSQTLALPGQPPVTPNSRAKRTLGELVRMQRRSLGGDDEREQQASKAVLGPGEEDDEGLRVEEELGEWINSDVSPYEPEHDSFFLKHKRSDEDAASASARTPATTPDGDSTTTQRKQDTGCDSLQTSPSSSQGSER